MGRQVTLRQAGRIGLLEINHPPVNASSSSVRQGILDCLGMAAADAGIEALVLCCAGSTFMAGADIREFDLAALPPPDANEVHAALAGFPRPVVAALHGTVLGGGLELALACHFRIAQAGATLGLPEVKLGLVPGSGGTQRLPRLIDPDAALGLIVKGEAIGAEQALALGLVDAVVAADASAAALAFALRLLASPGAGLPRPARQVVAPPSLFARYRAAQPAAAAGGEAVRAAIDCVEHGLAHGMAAGLAHERAAFLACRDSHASRALRHIFFAEREARRIPGLGGATAPTTIASVGVVGAGTMGRGIAMTMADAGLPVVLLDLSPEAVRHAVDAVRATYQAALDKGRLTQAQRDARLALVTATTDEAALADCDLVIEAVFENLKIKQEIAARLGVLCKPGAIIASNTSTLDIDLLAAASGRPAHFLGMHFFSPAHVMKLLEIVRGAATSAQVLASAMALARVIGKSAVVSGVCYGFIGNRMLEGYLRETEFLLMEGVPPARIDGALEAFGMAMGPCRMIDMAGVDVAAKVVLERQANAADPAYRAVVRELYRRGRFGQKSGAGYYRYAGRSAHDDPELVGIVAELARAHGIMPRSDIGDEEIVERCLYPLINEGARILDDGSAYRAGDIDVVWVRGYGFPAHKGGPMHLARQLGGQLIAGRLASYGAQRGNDHGYWSVSERLKSI